MARPPKEGLEYFPLDVDIAGDDKLLVVVGKYGNRGFGLIIRLMCVIYDHGYYYRWTVREQYAFSQKVVEPIEYVNEVVDECIKWGFFSEYLYERYKILSSYGFQKRYRNAVGRRKDNEIKPEYLLDKEGNPFVSADNNPVQEELPIAEMPQSKVKERKVKEINNTSSYSVIISYLNEKTGKNFSDKSEANRKLINGRMAEGRTVEDFLTVIDIKVAEWLDNEKMNKYLQPGTLFRPGNFEKYLNQEPTTGKSKRSNYNDQDYDDALREWVNQGGTPDTFVFEREPGD